MSKSESGSVNQGLITSEDRPTLAESGRQPAPASGASREELKAAVLEAVEQQMSLMGNPAKTAKDAGNAGKWAVDKLTDKGKNIEDKATGELGEAERKKHMKDNKDGDDKSKGQKGHAADLGVPVQSLLSVLQDVRAGR